jgi:hypothetical protein
VRRLRERPRGGLGVFAGRHYVANLCLLTKRYEVGAGVQQDDDDVLVLRVRYAILSSQYLT